MASERANKQLVYNLRFKFKERLEKYTDDQIINAYDKYAVSEDYGDEEKFLLWLTEE